MNTGTSSRAFPCEPSFGNYPAQVNWKNVASVGGLRDTGDLTARLEKSLEANNNAHVEEGSCKSFVIIRVRQHKYHVSNETNCVKLM